MKKICWMPVFLSLALMALVSCGESEKDSGGKTKEPTVFSLGSGGTYNADVTEVSIPVQCDASWDVAVTSGETWAKVLSTDKTSDGGSARIGMDFNLTDDFRSAELKFTSGTQSRTVRILQKGISSMLDHSSLYFTEPRSVVMNVTTQSAWTAASSDGASWYTMEPTSGSAGSTKMTVTVTDEFLDKGSRSSAIRFTIGGRSFDIPVVQGQKNAIIADAEPEYRFSPEGGSLEIRTRTNVGRPYVKVEFEGGSESGTMWIKHLSTKAMDEHVHAFSIEGNVWTFTRRAGIIFYVETDGGTVADTVTVIQKGIDPILQLGVPGAYDLAGDSWLYRSGTDLLSRLYPSGGKTVDMRIVNPSDVSAIEICGIPTDAKVGDTFTLSFRYMQLGDTVISSSHAVSVIKVGTDDQEGLVWLREEDGPGFIVKR